MTPLEICLILVGVILSLFSFFITEKFSKREIDEVTKMSSEEIKRIIEGEVLLVKDKVDVLIDQCLEDGIIKAEDQLSKLSNEKIMSIHEYSETVLSEINKNHNEVMFLYSMMCDKQVEFRELVTSAESTYKELTQIVRKIQEIKEETSHKIEKKQMEKSNRQTMEKTAVVVPKNVTKSDEETMVPVTEKKEVTLEKELEEATKDSGSANHNKRILEFYDAGKPAIEIAKELSLGYGEVKLVIDLFRGVGA